MSNISQRVKGDKLAAEAAVLLKNGIPRELTGDTVAFLGLTAAGAAWITEAATYVTAQATVTVTFDSDRNEVLSDAHGMIDGDEVVFANSGGALPTGLVAATRYQVTDITPHRFKVRLTPNDEPLNFTTAGTGTNTYYQVGYVEYAYQGTETATAGDYKGWFTVTSGGVKDTHPNTAEGLAITFVTAGG